MERIWKQSLLISDFSDLSCYFSQRMSRVYKISLFLICSTIWSRVRSIKFLNVRLQNYYSVPLLKSSTILSIRLHSSVSHPITPTWRQQNLSIVSRTFFLSLGSRGYKNFTILKYCSSIAEYWVAWRLWLSVFFLLIGYEDLDREFRFKVACEVSSDLEILSKLSENFFG